MSGHLDEFTYVRHNCGVAARGRPKLDPSADAHSPRLAVRLPRRVQTGVARRAAEEGRSISNVVRSVVEAWLAAPTAAELAEIRRIVRLTDRQREALFLTSSANVGRLLARRQR
jgi:hypothetical protein